MTNMFLWLFSDVDLDTRMPYKHLKNTNNVDQLNTLT